MSEVRRALGVPAKQAVTSTYSDHVAEEAGRAARFAQLLREHREALKLKQEEVAERSGVHLSTYSRWERGQLRNPIPEDVQAVCKVVRLSTVTAGIVLGYLAPEEAEQIPEPPRRFDPLVEEAIAILEDDSMSDTARQGALAYLQFLQANTNAEKQKPGTGNQSRAS